MQHIHSHVVDVVDVQAVCICSVRLFNRLWCIATKNSDVVLRDVVDAKTWVESWDAACNNDAPNPLCTVERHSGVVHSPCCPRYIALFMQVGHSNVLGRELCIYIILVLQYLLIFE